MAKHSSGCTVLFTGEAFMLLKTELYTDNDVKEMLWNTYVAYWSWWGEANKNNPALQAILKAKAKKVRKRRAWTLESLLRQKDTYGKPKFIDPRKEEEKRQRKAMNDAAYARTMALLAEEAKAMQGNSPPQQTKRPSMRRIIFCLLKPGLFSPAP